MKNTFCCLFVLLISICSYSQEKQLIPKGVIVDSVKVDNAIDESYAVYLPKQYDKKIPSAIVFIFEPGARGKMGIEPFILASETYNYILVCSNNSKNGPNDINLEVANRLFESVFGRFNINPSQLYISGFSGGSRLAGSIAISSGAFQAVIGCGASFSGMDKFALQGNSFSYVGMVGDTDMNYQEMIENKTWLDRIKINNTLLVSHENHTWPKQKEMLRAFDWLEIQVYKKSIRLKNDSIIQQIYTKNLKIADSLFDNKEMIAALAEYERCNAIYDDKENTEIKSIIAAINKSKEYKTELKKREEIKVQENDIINNIVVQFDKELPMGKSKDDFKFWKLELKKLNDRKLKTSDVATANMVDRLQFMIKALVYETAQESKRNHENDKLAYCIHLENLIRFSEEK